MKRRWSSVAPAHQWPSDARPTPPWEAGPGLADEGVIATAMRHFLSDMGVESYEDGVVELLQAQAQYEAVGLLGWADRVGCASGRLEAAAPSASALRVAAGLRRGGHSESGRSAVFADLPGLLEASENLDRLRKLRNTRPLPQVLSMDTLELPEDCSLLAPSYRLELEKAHDPWESVRVQQSTSAPPELEAAPVKEDAPFGVVAPTPPPSPPAAAASAAAAAAAKYPPAAT